MRRLVIAIGVMAGVVVGMVAATMVLNTTAEDGGDVTLTVAWSALPEAFEARCDRHRSLESNTPIATVNGFVEVVTIRDAEGTIVSMTALRDGELDEGQCRLTVTAALAQSAGHTVWLDDAYLASIPSAGLPDHASIVLEDWD